jgi:hypothetical protein
MFGKLRQKFSAKVEEKSISLSDPEAHELFGIPHTASGISMSPSNFLNIQ